MIFVYRSLFILSFIVGYYHSHAGNWRVAYDGFGKTHSQGERGMVLKPKAALRANETHAALMLSKETEDHPVTDFVISFRYKVREQLRKPASTIQPWETLWLFFNYKPDGQYKKTNYLVLKDNGIEVGKAWGDIDQQFVYTASEPRLKNLEKWHDLKVTRHNKILKVQIDDQPVKKIEIPPGLELYNHPGALGLYSEDAHVVVENIHFEPLIPNMREINP